MRLGQHLIHQLRGLPRSKLRAMTSSDEMAGLNPFGQHVTHMYSDYNTLRVLFDEPLMHLSRQLRFGPLTIRRLTDRYLERGPWGKHERSNMSRPEPVRHSCFYS